MKKKREILFPFGDEVRLRFRKMKLTVLLTFLVIASFGSGFSQVTLSLHFDKATIHEVLGSIEKKTDYIFMYKDDIFNSSKAISVDFEDAKFEEVLKSICEQSNVDYEVRDRQIILKERVNLPMPLAEQQPQKKEISGTVKDSKGLPLPGVSVVVKGTTLGIITDADGKFMISVPVDSKILAFSFVGMKTQEIAIGKNAVIDVSMAEIPIGLNEVRVTALGIKRDSKSITYSTQEISGDETTKVPETNFMNSLSGKVSGIQINRNAAGLGGAVKKPDQHIRFFSFCKTAGSTPA